MPSIPPPPPHTHLMVPNRAGQVHPGTARFIGSPMLSQPRGDIVSVQGTEWSGEMAVVPDRHPCRWHSRLLFLGPASPAIFSSLGSCLSLGLCTCFSHFLPCCSLLTPAFPSVECFLGAVCVDISRAFPRLCVSPLSWAAPGQGLGQPFGSRACLQGLAHVCRRCPIMNLGKCFMCFQPFSQS